MENNDSMLYSLAFLYDPSSKPPYNSLHPAWRSSGVAGGMLNSQYFLYS